MANVTVKHGASNQITVDVNNTADIRENASLAQVLGVDFPRVDLVVNGSVYDGPLYDGDVVQTQVKSTVKNV